MAKKGNMPELIFIGPIGAKGKMRFEYVLFTVEEWDENGIPRKLTLRAADESLSTQEIVDSGTEFMTAYIQKNMLDPHPAKANKKVKWTI